MKLTLPKWYDLHVHMRQGDIIPDLIKDHLKMGCAGILAMPNTKPPVAKVFKSDDLPYWSIEEYLETIKKSGGDQFDDIIVPLYLTKDTTAEMIEKGAESGLLRACKYYPPHGTTGAEFGDAFDNFIESGVFEAIEKNGVTLCVHGEEHAMECSTYFDKNINAEVYFYENRVPKLVDKYPDIRLACEHITTKTAVSFVKNCGENVAASITPQHLMFTVGDLLKGLQYHLYCLPLLKFDEDRAALLSAVLDRNNTKFYAGTDSAPHTEKVTPCGCAAGCYTGGIAPQLYAQAFENAGADLSSEEGQASFKNFLCLNGPKFYDLPIPDEKFVLENRPQNVSFLQSKAGAVVPLPLGLQADDTVQIDWSIE